MTATVNLRTALTFQEQPANSPAGKNATLERKIKEKSLPLLSGAALCTEDVNADISYCVRTVMPDGGGVPAQALGITTGLNTFQGMMAAVSAHSRYQAASAIDDTDGKVESGIDFARGVFQSIGGASYIGYRATEIPVEIKGLSATTTLGKAAYWTGLVGNIAFTIFYAMMGVWGTFCLVKNRIFSSKLESQKTDQDLANFLKQQVDSEKARFSAATSGDCVTKVQKAFERGLEVRLNAEDQPVKESAVKELHQLRGKVVQENTKAKWIYGALVAIAVIGIGVSVVSFFPILPVLAAHILLGFTVVLACSMGLFDAYYLNQGYENGPPGRYDKLYLIAIGVILLGAMGLSVGLTLGFGLPLIQLYFAGAIAAGGVSMAGFSFAQICKKEKLWKENHPEVQDLVLTEGPVDAKMMEVFKKLPKETRQEVRSKYSEQSLPFRTEHYLQLDANHDFGGNYLEQADPQDALLQRALKKSAKFFWKEWFISKAEADKSHALIVEKLLEKIKRGVKDLVEIKSDRIAYDKLKNDIWYLAKRQESQIDLKSVINLL